MLYKADISIAIITFQVELSPSVTNTPLRERIVYQELVERARQI
jgi:hypothetical protein